VSSKRWPHGALSKALTDAHRRMPMATAPELAREVGCDPGCARVVLRNLGLPVPPAKEQRVTWTPAMKQALFEGVLLGRSVEPLAERIGVSTGALILGAMELIRDLLNSSPLGFFVGVHQPCDARHVAAAFISVHRLADRVGGFEVGDWIMDSGAFSTILKHRGYPDPPETYARQIKRWSQNGRLLAAVTQDYMCEAHMLALTGLSVAEHQRLTVERFDAISACDLGGVYLMPVLQGYAPQDYVAHIETYGDRLGENAWVGVGSVCKRNGNPAAIEAVLLAIKAARPDLRLHGFGLKLTALASALIRALLATADSMAWSYSARKQGRNGNSIQEALRFVARVSELARAPAPRWAA
jgi:hypothetical protein